jgi:hypothetical protein
MEIENKKLGISVESSQAFVEALQSIPKQFAVVCHNLQIVQSIWMLKMSSV